jgi:RimJ/RimL family protein N-acetyltransferase
MIAVGNPMKLSQQPDEWFENGLDLSGPQTRLRRPSIQDVDAILRIFCDAPEVTRFVAWRPMHSEAEAREFLANVISGWAQRRPSWLVEDVASGEAVGSIIAACDGDEVEVSYVVAPAWWGRGHATTALRLVAEGALSDDSVHRVRAYCDAENTASMRVLEKAGFRQEARLPEHGLHNVSPDPRDCFVYVRERG